MCIRDRFKLEGQTIMRHPEYDMDDRLILDKIDFDKMTVLIDGKTYGLNDHDFPTIDPKHPYNLTQEEAEVVSQLIYSFMQSEKLQRHVKFLFSQGSIYLTFNGNLLFHGCIPMTKEGEFYPFDFGGVCRKGKELMDLSLIHISSSQISAPVTACAPRTITLNKGKKAQFTSPPE